MNEEYPTGFKAHTLTKTDRDNFLCLISTVWARRELAKSRFIQGSEIAVGGSRAQKIDPTFSVYIGLGPEDQATPVSITVHDDSMTVYLINQDCNQ